MKNSSNKTGLNKIFQLTGLLIILLSFTVSAVPAFAQSGDSAKQNKIHITSDKLVSDQASHTDFIGHVKTKYKNYDLTSDKLRLVFFTKEEKAAKSNAPGGNIKTIIATGNVEILFDDRRAVSEKAEYHMNKDLIILSGKNAQVITGNNSLKGNRIEINTKTNRVQADGSGTGQVEVIFYSEGEVKK